MNLQLPTTELKHINPKDLGSRKKIDILYGKDKDENLCIVFHIIQKSRVLVKDVDIFEDLYVKAQAFLNISFDKKYINITSPLCSKAKLKLESLNWYLENLD